MKKISSLALILCMLISLFSLSLSAAAHADNSCDCPADCDCRLRALTAAEEEQIFLKVAAQKGISVPTGLSPDDILIESLEMRLTYDTGDPASIDDYDKFWLTARVKNLGSTPIESISIKLRLLDSQGNELDAQNWDELIADLLLPGETGIVERMNNVTRVEDIAAVQLLYYRCSPDFSKKIIFPEPYTYTIDEIFGAAAGSGENSGKDAAAGSVTLGESIATDSAELKITGVSFTDELKMSPPGEQAYLLTPGPNMVYAQIHFDLTNLDTENHAIGELVSMGIEYKEGFVYDMENASPSCYICDDFLPGIYTSYRGSGSYDRNLVSVPLVPRSYTLCIPCPEIVAKDETGLLKINLSVENAGSRERYSCTVRDENSSQVSLEYTGGTTVYVA